LILLCRLAKTKIKAIKKAEGYPLPLGYAVPNQLNSREIRDFLHGFHGSF